MNTSLLAPLPPRISDPVKKKRVLLLDTSHRKRELRAGVLRKLGIDVDSAADIAEARVWWKPALYDLVLINMEKGRGQRDKFCDDLRGATPAQRVAFLVGRPEFVTDSPNADQELAMVSVGEQVAIGSVRSIFAGRGEPTQCWGILEASRQISAVRSASIARTQAMRALPPPPRDSEGRPPKPSATRMLNELWKEG
jgi:CheY-like chemotaxis protein